MIHIRNGSTDICHIYHIYRTSSGKGAASGLPELSGRFLDDSNSWNVNATPSFRTLRQMLKSIGV